MALVAVIDDREDVRKRLTKKFKRYLKKEGVFWDIEHFEPLGEVKDYPNWISHNKVVLLIVDERLKEVRINGGNNFASYNGHDLVNEVRKTNKQLPIQVVTAHADDEILDEMKGQFDGVVQRDGFNNDESSNQLFQRFVRGTQSYLDNFNKEYARLAELSELVALNKVTEEESKELKALQSKLQLPLSSFIAKNRVDWIEELDGKTKELNDLSSKIEDFLKE